MVCGVWLDEYIVHSEIYSPNQLPPSGPSATRLRRCTYLYGRNRSKCEDNLIREEHL